MASAQDEFGTSALHEAAQAGWEDLADISLKAGAPPSLKDKKEKTPLHYAALNGSTEIISSISEAIQNEILPQPSGSADFSSGRNGIVPMSKDQGDPSAVEEAFCDAAEAGKLDVIVRVLKYHVNLADSKKRGRSALMFAIHGEHEKIGRRGKPFLSRFLTKRPNPSTPGYQMFKREHVNHIAGSWC